MSSSTITVNPRRRPARSPPPQAAKTDDTTPKGTVLLRNPLPKYSFQQKLDKKKERKDRRNITDTSETKSPVEKDLNTSKVTFELQTPVSTTADKDVPKLDSVGDKSDQDADMRIGVLVNSFPQNSGSFINQTAVVEKPINQGGPLKKASNSIGPEVVKTMIDKLKPVNIVDPITCSSSSGTRLSHSYSESAISSTSAGFQPQHNQNLGTGQGSASVLPVLDSAETSLHEHGQTGAQSTLSDEDDAEALAGTTADLNNQTSELVPNNETSGLVPSSSGGAIASSCQCQERVRLLEEEKQLLKQQLEVQLQVNCELKKLLVASVGEDLHHRVERLTRDRALMSQELGDFSRKLSEDYEHMDKISIQADMWRSKYLASRVMSDELASAKAFYTMQYQECQMALQQLLNERHELRANLFETYRGLHQIRGAFDPLNSEHSSNQLTSKNVLDLARANQQLAEAIKYRLLPSHVTSSLANKIEPDWHDYLTKAETHARELLAREVRPEDFRHLVPRALTAPIGMTVDRFHPCTRFDNLTINVCCKCKGDISIV